jgi:non-heme chloroperoxidase
MTTVSSEARSPLSRFAASGPVRIHYLDSAAGRGPDGGPGSPGGPGDGDRDGRAPLVFVPGLTDVAADYLPVLGEFGRRTIVVDLRGRGASGTPDATSGDASGAGYAAADHVGDVEAVVDAAGVESFHLATFSRGTPYGLGFAFARPDRVLSVTIGDYPAREIGLPAGVADTLATGRWRGEPVLDRIAEAALHGVAAQSVERPLWDRLGALGRPVLVIRSGRVDRRGHVFLDDDAQDRYRQAVPGVEIVTFDDSGHDLFRPDPTRYPRLVAAFTARHEPGPPPR